MKDNSTSRGRIGTLIACAALVIGVLSWISPFNPVGPSPLHVSQEKDETTQKQGALHLRPESHQEEPRISLDLNQEQEATLPRVAPSRPQQSLEEDGNLKDLGDVIVLTEGNPHASPGLSTVMSVSFRETMGSRYAEFAIAPLGQPLIRFPARRAGASEQFMIDGAAYEVTVISLDLKGLTANVIVRPRSRN